MPKVSQFRAIAVRKVWRVSAPAATYVTARPAACRLHPAAHARAKTERRHVLTAASSAKRRTVRARVRAAGEPAVVAADHLGVPHEVAPRLHEREVVAARAQRGDDVGPEPRLEPQRARGLAPGTSEEPAGRLDG